MQFFKRADLVPMSGGDFAEFICRNFKELTNENVESRATREFKIITDCIIIWGNCKNDADITDAVLKILSRSKKIRNDDLQGKLLCLIATSISLTCILAFEDLICAIRSPFWKLETFAKSVEKAAWARVRHGGRLRRVFSRYEMRDLLVLAEFFRNGDLEDAEEYIVHMRGKAKYIARKFLCLGRLITEGNVEAAADLAIEATRWRKEEGGILMPVLFQFLKEKRLEEARIFAGKCTRARGRVAMFFYIALITGYVHDMDRAWKEAGKLRDNSEKERYWRSLTAGYRFENKVAGRQNITRIKDPVMRHKLLRKLLGK